MKTREIFEETRKRKNRFSLRTRLMVLVTVEIIVDSPQLQSH